MAKPRKHRGRNINGILLLDKPIGITSNTALQSVKRIYQARKAGHTGSLDPLASGLLPICFGEATKYSQFLLECDKKYYVEARLGISTTTGDTEGECVQESPVPTLNATFLESVLAKFRGDISQVPSMYSALKHNGQPLYQLARQGIEVPRQARTITIYALELQDFTANTLTITVHCSKGTYIRTLVEDLGKVLGCGAHVTLLRRVHAGHYDLDKTVTLEQLEALKKEQNFTNLERLLLPIETAVTSYPAVKLTQTSAFYLQQGQVVRLAQVPADLGLVRLIDNEQRFLGVGEILDDGRIAPRRLLSVAKREHCVTTQ